MTVRLGRPVGVAIDRAGALLVAVKANILARLGANIDPMTFARRWRLRLRQHGVGVLPDVRCDQSRLRG